jgi:nucleoside-diphosphate-sugar epimerase
MCQYPNSKAHSLSALGHAPRIQETSVARKELSMNVLFVGATGTVGRQVVPILNHEFKLTLAALGGGKISSLSVVDVDITNWEAVEELVHKGTEDGLPFDAVVNCAIADYRARAHDKTNPKLMHAYHEQCIEVNAKGAYHLYEAAARAGVPQVVYISSLTAFFGPPRYAYIDENTPDRPRDVYAACKVFGEHVGRYYAHRSEEEGARLKVVCLRLGQPYRSFTFSDDSWQDSLSRRSVATDARDIAQAIQCALEVEVQFGVYPIVSEADSTYIDPQLYAELGYKPCWKFTAAGLSPADTLVEDVHVARRPSNSIPAEISKSKSVLV